MAFSLNKVMLIGNLGQDAETKVTANNHSVTNFSVATTHSYKDKDGNWVSETTWHNIVAWSLSDYVKNNLKKGRLFYIEGRISKREYEKDNQKRYVFEINADVVKPLDSSENKSDYQSYDPAVGSAPNNQVNTGFEGLITPDDLPF